jgi:hypothetical protein
MFRTPPSRAAWLQLMHCTRQKIQVLETRFISPGGRGSTVLSIAPPRKEIQITQRRYMKEGANVPEKEQTVLNLTLACLV